MIESGGSKASEWPHSRDLVSSHSILLEPRVSSENLSLNLHLLDPYSPRETNSVKSTHASPHCVQDRPKYNLEIWLAFRLISSQDERHDQALFD